MLPEYISTIIECEKMNADIPLIKYLAKGMSDYMTEKINSYSCT